MVRSLFFLLSTALVSLRGSNLSFPALVIYLFQGSFLFFSGANFYFYRIQRMVFYTGGLSAANHTLYGKAESYQQTQYYQTGAGEGFSTFCFILGFVILTAAGIYISPLCTGSENERRTLCSPTEFGDDGSASSAFVQKSAGRGGENSV